MDRDTSSAFIADDSFISLFEYFSWIRTDFGRLFHSLDLWVVRGQIRRLAWIEWEFRLLASAWWQEPIVETLRHGKVDDTMLRAHVVLATPVSSFWLDLESALSLRETFLASIFRKDSTPIDVLLRWDKLYGRLCWEGWLWPIQKILALIQILFALGRWF